MSIFKNQFDQEVKVGDIVVTGVGGDKGKTKIAVVTKLGERPNYSISDPVVSLEWYEFSGGVCYTRKSTMTNLYWGIVVLVEVPSIPGKNKLIERSKELKNAS